MNKGITGILRPNGELLCCSYGNHGYIAKNIPIEEEMNCIYLSSSIETNNNDEKSLIYFNENITQKQLDWFIENMDKLDNKQCILWVKFIENEIDII